MAGRIRNKGCVPYIGTEGVFLKPIVKERFEKDTCFQDEMSPYHRLFVHHTLASTRRNAHFKNFKNLVPVDQLDLILTSQYNQSTELFADNADIHLQPETVGVQTWRRLRNTRELTPDRESKAAHLFEDGQAGERDGKSKKKKKKQNKVIYNFATRLLIGGISEKIHPSSVKLMNSSHHSPQTNAGYSRQPSDGNAYQY